MPSEIETYRMLVQQEGMALLADLDGLGPDDWSRRSPCDEWDVLDVLVHLRLGNDFHVAMVRNLLAGRNVPPWADMTLPAEVSPSEYFRRAHRDAHAEGPAANLAAFRVALDAYAAALAEATQADLARTGWFYGGDAPLRQIVGLRIFDLIMHASDIRRPAGIAPVFTPDGARFAGKAANFALAAFWRPELAHGLVGAVRHDVDGETATVVVSPDGLRPATPDTVPDATIKTDGGTWALLTWRKLPLDDAIRAGTATVTGDAPLLRGFLGAIRTP
jgi:uncharacterized protein (TIGR03083 family)